jgi:uncharacterized protein YecE (DUF72 family)
LPQARELAHASRHVTTIEINATFYRTQKAESFRKWAAETPDDFVFAVKGPQFASHRRVLAEAGAAIERFFDSGVLELGRKLGPILWQMHPHKKFEPDDFAAFLALLPRQLDGRPVRHAVEVRHQSFIAPDFIDLLRSFGAAATVVDSEKHPLIADVTADFVYARLERTSAKVKSGYGADALATWARRAQAWASGGVPDDVRTMTNRAPARTERDVFVYMISGAKVRNPAAAMALLDALKRRAG